jgi:hypothetical protein
MPYQTGALPERAHIFLVAGGSDSANFAQEIVDQRRLWKRAGFEDDQIACYWAKPTHQALREDGRQYRGLLDELAGCYSATPEILREHLHGAAGRALPFVYLYVTSHGTHSILEQGLESEDERTHEVANTLTDCEAELLDRHALALDGDGGLYLPHLVASLRAGDHPADLMLTPAVLRMSLGRFAPEVPKVVVIQGCFSGGFIDEDGDPQTADGLRAIPNLTLLTAARHDRTSFGCQPGARATEFGSAFTWALQRTRGRADPSTLPWETVFARTQARVQRRERAQGLPPSLPAYYRSTDGASSPQEDIGPCDRPRPRAQ